MKNEIINTIKAVKKAYPDNLMARHFDEDYFALLDENKQQKLLRIINSGIKNPNSQMGAYAMHPSDYDEFSPLFDRLIKDYHGIKNDAQIEQLSNWDSSKILCDLASIDKNLNDTSMRVRVARNVNNFPLVGAMTKKQRIEFENIASNAFEALAKHKDFSGKYYSLTPNSPYAMTKSEYKSRIDKHQMFKDMSADKYLSAAGISADWPYGRGIYISQKEDFLVWVGEEDHLRIMAMQIGSNLNDLFNRLYAGLKILEQLLPPFAISATYGNITSCPTNLGAGMRASLHIKLPSLTNNGTDLSKLKTKAKELGLSVRGARGEHSDADSSGLVDISPSARLGVSEVEIMVRLYQGVAKLWQLEIDANINSKIDWD